MKGSNNRMNKLAKGLWKTTQIKVAIAISVVFIGAYVAWFVGKMGFGLSPRPEDWGYFGSYTAGTIGMAFALATVWMLAETLKTQREELELTRAELAKSSAALESQVHLAQEAREMEFFYYSIKTVDNNIETICNQPSGHNPSASKIWGYGEGKVRLTASPQIRSIVSNYVHLIREASHSSNRDQFRKLVRLTIPISLKYNKISTKAYEDGYLSQYSKDLQSKFVMSIHSPPD